MANNGTGRASSSGRFHAIIMALAVVIAALPAAVRPATAAEQPFGERLVAAARKQTWLPVIYNPAYVKIPYPNGDVPWYYGVCTDVVVRAYRALGADLQVLVKTSGAGTGDTNIDHRRVPILKTFFAKAGRSLPVTRESADYAPGDIVTFHLPDGRYSKTHIAIVSDRKSPAGTPLVIHNRGWGVSEEDWLFSNKITGHYRFEPRMAAATTAAAGGHKLR